MMQFLEFTFRDLPHFIGIVVLMVIVAMTIEAVVVAFANAVRGAK